MTKDEAINDILAELRCAEHARPEWPDNIFEAISILTEEVGELAQAANDWRFSDKNFCHIMDEAVQVGAMAIRLLMNGETYRENK